ncbi:hypothetical protein [Streptomyces sp. RTd22]|uniref:hypothetical protein n=1 Tax=Streptomyces sp. RTd22 TaxID=1841249 RepID=UPI0007C4C6EA|nr:hypothetical protein [Streptomyces sp. RTd22]
MRQFIRARRRTAWAGVALAVAVAAGLGTWATDTWPFDGKDTYCWGAWEEDSGPAFLSDEAVEEDGADRTSEETAPAPERQRGRCTVALHTEDVSSGEKYVDETEITVGYGPAPKDAARRMEWAGGYLNGRAMPLPDGLPGVADGKHALLVLPERCDTGDGRPTAVTLDAKAETSSSDGTLPADPGLGGTRSVAELLVAAANRGMEAAGCAGSKPLRVVSPVLTLPEDAESYRSPMCRIGGLELGKAAEYLEYQVGAVTRDLQFCSVRTRPGGDQYFDALMVAQPRLSALFDGATGSTAPARGWRGTGVFADDYKVVRADCAGRPATFLMLAPSLRRQTAPHFVTFTNAVTRRIGCAPVAPGGSGR